MGARIAFAKKEGFGIGANTDIHVNNIALIRTLAGKTIQNS